jgi:hypothetical protein
VFAGTSTDLRASHNGAPVSLLRRIAGGEFLARCHTHDAWQILHRSLVRTSDQPRAE